MTKNKWLSVALALAIPVVAFASGTMELQADNSGSTVLSVKYSGATYPLFQVNTAGQHEWGSGTASADTNLYRSAADTLKTDDSLTVLGTLTASGDLTGDGGDQLVGYLMNKVTASTTALTAAQCGSVIVNAGAVVQPLPEASTVQGCQYTFVSGTADDFDIDPADATDQFGLADPLEAAAIDGGAGDEYRITDTGASFTIVAVGNDLWAVTAHNGSVTDVN